nr:hypothetical protein [Streptomyces antibioticus]
MRKKREAAEPVVSASERLLFGGPLRYDMGWNQHADAFLALTFRAMVTRLPGMLASSLRLARQADARAARTSRRRRWTRGPSWRCSRRSGRWRAAGRRSS